MALIGLGAIFLGILVPLCEAWIERDWPRGTIGKAIPVIIAGLLCLSVAGW